MSDSLDSNDAAVAAMGADARLAGIFYAINIATILGAIVLLRGIVVASDPAATATNLVAHATRYESAIALGVISTVCSIAVCCVSVRSVSTREQER